MKIMMLSDSPWAPTGFGTNTRCIAAIFAQEGHTVGYAGCQNPKHEPSYKINWPLGSQDTVSIELLPLLHPGEEKFGEKSFPQWVENFKPDLIFTHLDIQMFKYVTDAKQPTGVNLPIISAEGKPLDKREFQKLSKKAFKMLQRERYKVGSIIPIDGQPSIPNWLFTLKQVNHPVAMSYYGQAVMNADFDGFGDKTTVISHGVDTEFFKPKDIQKPEPDCFIVGCVARNQHRKNIPRLMRSFKLFVEKNKLTPDNVKLMLHMNWTDHMGWNIEYMASEHVYNIKEYMIPPTMGNLEQGQNPDDAGMVDIYNLMDVHALPTGGEGFGIPTVEAMSCGIPNIICNYTTSYEIVGAKKPECPSDKLLPHGTEGGGKMIISDRGILIPYKDMMWDTPIRAAPMRALWDEHEGAKAIEYYYKNRDVLKKHSENARKYAVKHYDWNKSIAPKWIEWIRKVKI